MYFDIYWADLNPVIEREQAGHRQVVLISNDIENQMDNVSIIPITSRKKERKTYPNEVLITLQEKEAIILCHQVRTISKQRLGRKIISLGNTTTQTEVIETLCMRFSPV